MKSARRAAQTIRPRKYVLPEHPRMLAPLARRRPTGPADKVPCAYTRRVPLSSSPAVYGNSRARDAYRALRLAQGTMRGVVAYSTPRSSISSAHLTPARETSTQMGSFQLAADSPRSTHLRFALPPRCARSTIGLSVPRYGCPTP
jgi:hypothetical protein